MISRAQVLGQLAPFENKSSIVVADQTTGDIMEGIIRTHGQYKKEYDRISEYFLGATDRSTARNIWNFLKRNVPYKIESVNAQTLRSPAAIVAMPADCKSYALFANGVLDSLNRKGLLEAPIAYRFASYRERDRKEPKHVFAVMYPGSDFEIWIDPVLNAFDEHNEPKFNKDTIIEPMALMALSGVPETREGSIRKLIRLKSGLQAERVQLLSRGKMILGDPADMTYRKALAEVDAQINNGGIGEVDTSLVSNALDVAKAVFSIFKHKSDPSGQWEAWDRIDVREGAGLGASAADVILHNRQDVPAINIINYIAANGIAPIMANRKYGTVTIEKIANYLSNNGFPDEAAALKKAAAPAASRSVLSPGAPGAMGNALWYLLGGGAALYLLTKSR